MRRSLIYVPVLLCAAFLSAGGQTAPNAASAAGDRRPVRVTLGDSAAELYGPWRFHTGDDPAWAAAGFDDTGWDVMDLTPPAGSADADLGTSGFIPGWTARGYPDYAGFAWYRMRIDVEGARTRLALRMPYFFDDAYQVFVNGQQIGDFGKFAGSRVTAYNALPRSFSLPPGTRNGSITIAIRMWMDSATRFNSPDAGGMHGPPVIGHAPVIATQVHMDWDGIAHDVGVGFLETLVLLLALAVAITHFWIDRTDKAYLWLGLVSLATLLGNALVMTVEFTTWIPQTIEVFLADVVAAPLRIGLWVLFWAYWFRAEIALWLQRAVWALVGLLAIGTAMVRPPIYGVVIPVRAAAVVVPLLLTAKLALAGLLVWVTIRGIRKNRAEGWLALPAVLLAAMANYQHELGLVHVKTAFFLFGFLISLGTASTVLSLLLVTVMLSRRFLQGQRRKIEWKLEIEQAREVQQVLIPLRLPEIAGLTIESEYRPAREVGGDFFQIIPGEEDGSVLLIVGDVTGKGLRAGMLVALIVGVIQTAVLSDPDPRFILDTLNARLCERSHTSATCLVLHITSSGTITIVNAGHLPPYLNGNELPVEGSLPLGIIPDLDLTVARFRFAEGDVLTLMSDGVVEAQDEHGQMFGFDRVQEMLRRSANASDIAAAAQQFGQDDDILVLSIARRTGEMEPVFARAHAVAL